MYFEELEITVSVGAAGDLSVSVGVTALLINETTQGLLGNINNNKSDDFSTPLGEVLPEDSNEEYIYNNFGQLCEC